MIGHQLLREHDYALVDRLQQTAADLPRGLEVRPLIPPELRKSADLMPGLVVLSELTESQQVDCLNAMELQQRELRPLLFAALLRSDATTDRIIRHFSATLVAGTHSSHESIYLRQFDPRLFVQYEWLLTLEQRLQMFGPITSWTFYLEREWQTFFPPPDQVAVRSSRMRLTAGQATQLDDLQIINEALAQLPPAGVMPRQQRARTLYQLLARGREYGVARRKDMALFLEHGVRLHPEFDRHPVLQQRLQCLPEDVDLPYTAAVADLDATRFQQIRAEMNQGAGGSYHESR